MDIILVNIIQKTFMVCVERAGNRGEVGCGDVGWTWLVGRWCPPMPSTASSPARMGEHWVGTKQVHGGRDKPIGSLQGCL